MILTMDIGNTNIKIGLFDGTKLAQYWRLASKRTYTSDELGVLVTSLFNNRGVGMDQVQGIMLSSVVPTINYTVEHMCRDYFNVDPAFVAPGIKTGIKVAGEDPKGIGADRIVDVVAAYEKYGAPVLVLDFGTATTYDLVTAGGNFSVGITAPGIKISAEALWQQTAKLPNVEIKKPKTILAQETITSMQAGLVYGQIGQTEYIIKKVKEESGLADLKVVATGGLGRLIADETDSIDVYDPSLTLDGLKILYDKNSKVK